MSDDEMSSDGLKLTLESLFDSSDLYSVIGATKECNENELKKAYHKKSLEHHPDRKGGEKEKFQALGAVYKLLSDKDRRAVYDETGEIDEGEDLDPDKDWDQYWRLLFKVRHNSITDMNILLHRRDAF
jgi:DnaJ family protein C protein 9